MKTRTTLSLAVLGLLLATGCKKTQDGTEAPPPDDTAAPEPGPADAPTDRPALSEAECQTKGGAVVGDIGDGAIHRPDYRCESGQPPIGSIRQDGGPVAIEGSVCCPVAAS